ncbi:hypothetical protein NCS55_00371200 [Fusarium keratoplasticum]|nr:hypothetical protein NCS55_00371200 [Fusarium keratoplasticum]
MESLRRNQTTAAEASALWICTTHAMREEERRQARCSRRRELSLSQKRQDFLTLYQEEQSGDSVDEAHERTMATDILMALLKRAISLRGDLKVAIMSATLDAAKFQTFFSGAKSLEVPGRTFPVDVHYLEGATPHYGVCALRTVKHIPKNMGPGDILVFLPSVNEVEEFCSEAKNSVHGLEIFSLYAAMASENQSRVFAKSQLGSRKCTVATNISETRRRTYLRTLTPGRASIYTISTASAAQRASRSKPGVCIRLYTKETFDDDCLASTQQEF